MIIKLSGNEIKEIRKDLLEDVTKQEIRVQLNKQIDVNIRSKIEAHIKGMSWHNFEDKIKRSMTKETNFVVREAIKTQVIHLETVTKKDIIAKFDMDAFVKELKKEIKALILDKLK